MVSSKFDPQTWWKCTLCDFAGYIHRYNLTEQQFFSPAIWSKHVSFFHEKHRDHLGPPYLSFKLFFLGGNYWDWFEIIDPPNMACTKYIQISESEIKWTHRVRVSKISCLCVVPWYFHDFSISSYMFILMIFHDLSCWGTLPMRGKMLMTLMTPWRAVGQSADFFLGDSIFYSGQPLFDHGGMYWMHIECILNAYWMHIEC